MTHVFIVGSKGIPAQYGGFETFVENLTAGKQSKELKYHVSCMNNDEKHFEHNDADCSGFWNTRSRQLKWGKTVTRRSEANGHGKTKDCSLKMFWRK